MSYFLIFFQQYSFVLRNKKIFSISREFLFLYLRLSWCVQNLAYYLLFKAIKFCAFKKVIAENNNKNKMVCACCVINEIFRLRSVNDLIRQIPSYQNCLKKCCGGSFRESILKILKGWQPC